MVGFAHSWRFLPPKHLAQRHGTQRKHQHRQPTRQQSPSTRLVGECFAVLGREETSEVISATGDWKQVTLEFTTLEYETTISLGCRLGFEGQQVTGTAWFDDLKLEKVE
jgi:hypothetical protein